MHTRLSLPIPAPLPRSRNRNRKPDRVVLMSESPLVAHSLAEAYLYVMATPCTACGDGAWRAGRGSRDESAQDQNHLILPVSCAKCGAKDELRFHLPLLSAGSDPAIAVVNPSSEPSRIIDLAQWITLAHVIIEAASKEKDKQQARHLGIEAAQCLEEALKFYEEDNDLPGPDAFFHHASRRRFQEHPQQFSRQRLVNQRAKLPTLSVMRSRVASPSRKKKRWRFW